MTIKKILSLGYGYGSGEPFLDILFSYDQKNKLKSVQVLSVCGVTAQGNIFPPFERAEKNAFPPQTNENVCKIHLDASPVDSDLKSFFSSLPERKKSLSQFILLLKFISETKGSFFEPYIAQTDWYLLPSSRASRDPNFAQGYLDVLNSYSYDFYIALLRIATKTKPRGGTFSFMRQTSRLLEIEWALSSLESTILEGKKEIKILSSNLEENLIENKNQDLVLTEKLNSLSKVEENFKNFQKDLHIKFQKKNQK